MSPEATLGEYCRSLPPYVTVEQAASILQIGRSKAYELAHEHLELGEGHGLPCVRVGRQIRLPLERLLQLGEPADRTDVA